MLKRLVLITLLFAYGTAATARIEQTSPGKYADSFVLAPLYVGFTTNSAEKVASDATELKQRIGGAPHVLLGFAGFLDGHYPNVPLDQPLSESDMALAITDADTMIRRARDNGIIAHISITSGFFHGTNGLRRRAIIDDVRNAQWFADGLIATPDALRDLNNPPNNAWITPSRYALPMRTRIEEGTRILGAHLATLMAQNPDTFMTISGDGETEFTYERNYANGGETVVNTNETAIFTDYSPFMVQEFRDSIRKAKYERDLSPDSDDDGDGHTFNRDFKQSFTSWRLRYFDNSGPIRYPDYARLTEKLPTSGPFAVPGGFDAPRVEAVGDAYWTAWIDFRKHAIRNWVRDFASWITTSPDPVSGFQIPSSRFYSHQIPADLIFGESTNLRLKTSASYIETAVIDPLGSTAVTAFNGWDGKRHLKTATPQLYSMLFMTSDNWGIMEYNPSMPYANNIPPSTDLRYYMNELRLLYNFRPHLIVPFAWTDLPDHKRFSIKGTTFEKALHQFVLEIGSAPWFSWKAALR